MFNFQVFVVFFPLPQHQHGGKPGLHVCKFKIMRPTDAEDATCVTCKEFDCHNDVMSADTTVEKCTDTLGATSL